MSEAVSRCLPHRQLWVSNLSKVATQRLEVGSSPRPSGFKAQNKPLHHRAFCVVTFVAFCLLLILRGCARSLHMAGHRQVISCISKGSQNILIYNFIVTTFDCQGGGISAKAFTLARLSVAPPLLILLSNNH